MEDQNWNKIKAALEHPHYKWRTINGIVKETQLEPEVVKIVLSNENYSVITSSIPSKDGEKLYTTLEHLKEKQSSWEKLSASILNEPGYK